MPALAIGYCFWSRGLEAVGPLLSASAAWWGRMRKPAISIGLFGVFGSGNLGNEGSLEAMLVFLKHSQPGAELTCICTSPEKVTKDHGIPAISIGWPGAPALPFGKAGAFAFKIFKRFANFGRALIHCRRLDVMLMPGTGIADDFGESPWNMPLSLLFWCLAALLCGTKIGFVSIGAGPIHHPVSRRLYKAALRLAHYRSYRDNFSKNYMAGIGLDTSADHIFPDIAFKLPAPERTGTDRTKAMLTIGVGVMAYYGWRYDAEKSPEILRVYLSKLAQFVIWLLDQNCRVRLLIGELTDIAVRNDLLRMVKEARPALPEGRIIAEPAYSLQDVMQQIAETDIVIATRYHNLVAAIKLGKPSLSIGYAQKHDALLADAGLSAFCQPIEQLDVDQLCRQFTALSASHEQHEQRLRALNATYDSSLRRQDVLLEAEFFNSGQMHGKLPAKGQDTSDEHGRNVSNLADGMKSRSSKGAFATNKGKNQHNLWKS